MNALLKTPDLGTGALENRDRVGFARLRTERTARVFELMERLDLDACLFGRESNLRYLTGAHRTWLSLTKPFIPACVAVRESREVRLLSASGSYEGMPEELQPDDLYPMSWDPNGFIDSIAAVPGVAEAGRIGVDGMTPLFQSLLSGAFPRTRLVGIQPELVEVRRIKLDGEIACLRIAAATAEAALAAAIDTLRPGATGKDLQAAYMARMAVLGTSQFAQQGTFTAVQADGTVRLTTDDTPFREGSLVALAGGVLWAGYEGSLARTWWCGRQPPTAAHRSLHADWARVMSTVVARCRAGVSGAELQRAFAGAGPDRSLERAAVYSIGLGHEGPIAAGWLPEAALARQRLAPGMVLGVRAAWKSPPAGGFLGEEMVLVTDGEPELLTTLGHGPLAA